MATSEKGKFNKRIGNLLFYILAFLIAFGLLITLLGGIFYMMVKNNVNGITERHRSILRDIPVIRNAVGAESEYGDGIDYLSHYELKQKYRELEKSYRELQDSYSQALENIQNLQEANKAYLDKLREFENEADRLEEERNKLNKDIQAFHEAAANHDSEAFMAFFEQMDQQTAAEGYEKVLQERETMLKKKELADILSGMEPESAAGIISELGTGNMNTIIEIFASMGKESVSSILEQIEPAMASEIILKLSELYHKK